MSASSVPLIGIGILLIFGIIIFFANKSKKGKDVAKKAINKVENISINNIAKVKEKNTTKPSLEGSYVKNPNASINKEDIFNFMEFDRIQDNMIISKKGEKYTAVIKCKGINYNLMSEVEQLSVEEGFINFLNTLKFPIQLYVQAQNIDLKDNIRKFKENMEGLEKEYYDINSEYNAVINSLDSTDEEIQNVEDRRESVLNMVEYGQDIVRYVEKLSINKTMLQRNFYVLVSYYKSELTNASSFKKDEILDICYSELFTRVQNILSGLAMSSVSGKALSSNELAELLYSAYNRDDKNFINIKQALESGFHRLFSTSEDAIEKKNKRIIENMKKEAEYKALVALQKAIEEGNVTTMADIEDDYDENTSKMAINMIKNEKVPADVKEKAKKYVVDEYKKAKRERLQKRQEETEEMKKKVENSKQVENNEEEQQIPEQEENIISSEEIISNNIIEEKDTNVIDSVKTNVDTTNNDEDSIV